MSLKTFDIVYKLDPSPFQSNPLGEIMAIKCLDSSEKGANDKKVLVAYEDGHISLWDIREKTVVSWLKIDECPMTVNFDDNWKRGVVGSPSDKLEVSKL